MYGVTERMVEETAGALMEQITLGMVAPYKTAIANVLAMGTQRVGATAMVPFTACRKVVAVVVAVAVVAAAFTHAATTRIVIGASVITGATADIAT